MIPRQVKDLIVRIAQEYGDKEDKRKARNEPERCLTALLLVINAVANNTSARLWQAVECSFSESNLEEADKFLRRYKRRKLNGKDKRRGIITTV